MAFDSDADLALALQLQNEFYVADNGSNNILNKFQSEEPLWKKRPTSVQDDLDPMDITEQLYIGKCNAQKCYDPKAGNTKEGHNVVDDSLELFDPTPDIYALFREFDRIYFHGKLSCCEVKWSPRMTLCAGLCCYEGRGGLCSIRLSAPLLRLRPRKDLVQTLLHEMIHAYLFVTHNNKDHDAHGPEFLKHMHEINKLSGANITVYHTFHGEVDEYRKHWWQCNGPCKNLKPFFGLVKRAMNRAPGPNDTWWNDHQKKCNGIFTKIKSPEVPDKGAKRKLKEIQPTSETEMPSRKAKPAQHNDVPLFGGQGHVLGSVKNKDNYNHLTSIERFLKQVQNKNITPTKTSTSGRSTSDIHPKNNDSPSKDMATSPNRRSTSAISPPSKDNATSPKRKNEQKHIDTYFGLNLKAQAENKPSASKFELQNDNKQGVPRVGIMSGKELYDWIISDDEDDHPGPKESNSSALHNVNITEEDIRLFVSCPACQLKVPESTINDHLDQCLS